MSSNFNSKNSEHAVLTIFAPKSMKRFQTVNVNFGYFATSTYGSINLINLRYSVWAYPLGAQLAGPTAAYSLIKE
jgi:hypothetical protein